MSAREILEIPQNESINLLIDNAVRVGGAEPTGTIQIDANGLYNVAPYAAANVNVPQGIVPTGTIPITQNGLYDVTNYAGANVNVPEPSGSISITQNGTIDVKDYASANVNVPQGVFPTGSLSITQNGTYDVTNYAGANVNVPKVPDNMEIIPIQLTEDTTSITFGYSQNKTVKLIIIACYENGHQVRNAMHSITAMYTYGGSTPYSTLSLRNGFNYLPLYSGAGGNYSTCTLDDVNQSITVNITVENIMFRTDFEYTAYIYYEDT